MPEQKLLLNKNSNKMDAKFTPAVEDMPELCDDKSIYRTESAELDASNLPAGAIIPKLCPISVDFNTRKVIVCKRARVHADAAENASTISVKKGHHFIVGDIIGNGEASKAITKIDSSKDEFDVFTVSLGVAVSENDVLHEAVSTTEAKEKNVANFLNYARRVAGKGVGITPVGQAYMVKENYLIVPLTASDKENLTSRFMFV